MHAPHAINTNAPHMSTSVAVSRLRTFRLPTEHFRRVLLGVARRPLLSVALSVIGFSFLGPVAAIVLVATMLDDEFAHQFVMRRLGYLPGPVRMVPLMGAFVRARLPMLSSADIAVIYLAGPMMGIASATSSALAARLLLAGDFQDQVYVGAAISVALNLFNLLPIEPLDGGLVSRALPYPALLLFPALMTLTILHLHLATSPAGLTLLAGVTAITVRKVLRWRHYLHELRARLDNGDLAALRDLWLTLEVSPLVRVLVVFAYVLILGAAFSLLTALPVGTHYLL